MQEILVNVKERYINTMPFYKIANASNRWNSLAKFGTRSDGVNLNILALEEERLEEDIREQDVLGTISSVGGDRALGPMDFKFFFESPRVSCREIS